MHKDIITPQGNKIANVYHKRKDPCLVWLCGYHSDMEGSKALKMEEIAKELGLSSLRFDYSGHGKSGGNFEDGTISQWLNDAKTTIEAFGIHKMILVGSSMGGWISIKLVQHFKEMVKAMVLIAPAPDFTQDLMWNQFSDEVKKMISQQGFWLRPSPYDDGGYKVTKQLIEDGHNNLVLQRPIEFDGPIRILHGMCDEDVPFMRSIDLIQKFTSENAQLHLVKNGDHRLSTDENLNLLGATIKEIAQTIP